MVQIGSNRYGKSRSASSGSRAAPRPTAGT